MADSTDEDDARFLRSRQVGVLESDVGDIGGESVGVDVSSGEVSGAGNASSGEENTLCIVESSEEGPVGRPGSSAASGKEVAGRGSGFGEIEESDDELTDLDDDGDNDDASVHSSGSDARHDLDFLHDQYGKFFSMTLVAS